MNFSNRIEFVAPQGLVMTESLICSMTTLVLCQKDWKVRLALCEFKFYRVVLNILNIIDNLGGTYRIITIFTPT